MYGADIEPILANVEAVPTATFLTLVGKSSAVYKYAMAKVIEIKNLPNIANPMVTNSYFFNCSADIAKVAIATSPQETPPLINVPQ